MRCNNNICHRPYASPIAKESTPYICRLAPAENTILLEWFDRGEDFGYTLYWSVRDESCRSSCKVLPGTVTSIYNKAFNGCASLKEIIIPKSVTVIATYAFDGCTSLADVYYGGSAAEWSSVQIYDGNDRLKGATVHHNS